MAKTTSIAMSVTTKPRYMEVEALNVVRANSSSPTAIANGRVYLYPKLQYLLGELELTKSLRTKYIYIYS